MGFTLVHRELLWQLFSNELQIMQTADTPVLHHSPLQITPCMTPCPDVPLPANMHGVTILTDSPLIGMIVILYSLTGIYTIDTAELMPTPSFYIIPVDLQEGFNTVWWEEGDTICHYTSAKFTKKTHPFTIIFPGLPTQHYSLDEAGHYQPRESQLAFPLPMMFHVPPALTMVRALQSPPTLKQLAIIAMGRSFIKHPPLSRGRIGQDRTHHMVKFVIRQNC